MTKKLLQVKGDERLLSCTPASHSVNVRKSKTVGDLCLEIAEFAKDRDYRTLDYLMRMAATEAYDQTSDPLCVDYSGTGELVGLWDWDVSQNLAYVDPPAAKLFDVSPKASVTGLPLESYIKAIHPDDVAGFSAAVYSAAREGGCFKSTYRVVNEDRITWVFAKGSCFVGPGNVPVRFPGAIFDITKAMAK
jgi:PAS domain-containing protein